jgi:hypothetical protein
MPENRPLQPPELARPQRPFPVSVPGLTLTGGEVFASSKQRTIVNDDWKDIQPRFGFAYLLDPKTVLRGGYGIYYSQPRSAPPA